MVLYKKVFSLGKGVSFSDYIRAIRKKNFPNYVLTVDKIPSSENYQVQIFFVAPLWHWGLAQAFRDGVLLNNCTIQHSKDANNFTLQASPKTVNLFYVSFYMILPVTLLFFVFFVMIERDTFSSNTIFMVAITTILSLAPPLLIYFRDKKLLDKVGSLATEL